MEIKFGPAGLGPVKTAMAVLEQYSKSGIKACEIAFTYSIYIKPEEAKIIGEKASELGIDLSIHAPYWLNLNAKEVQKRAASRQRILKCCEIGELLGAKVVVFHPGYYANSGKDAEGKRKTYATIKSEIQEILSTIKENKWKIRVAPETMGRVNVFGSIEEISSLVKETGCSFCIDFAHILAREKKVDYERINALFPEKEWHCHFSGIVYGEKGEKHHISTGKKEWKELFKNLNEIAKNKSIRIINESPSMLEDSIEGISIWKKIMD